MVRTIDQDERRRRLAEAVWRLLRRGGLPAASVRAVAAEAGLSAGSVRHFFATQDALHVFAMEELMRRETARVESTLRSHRSGAGEPPGPEQARAQVVAGLAELLPRTEEQTADYQAHLQFLAHAAVSPVLAPTATWTVEESTQFYHRCLGFLVERGAAAPGLDLADATRGLAVLMDGLVLRRLTAPHLLSSEQMMTLLTDHLVALQPPEAPS